VQMPDAYPWHGECQTTDCAQHCEGGPEYRNEHRWTGIEVSYEFFASRVCLSVDETYCYCNARYDYQNCSLEALDHSSAHRAHRYRLLRWLAFSARIRPLRVFAQVFLCSTETGPYWK
jgi:hypothetical protein